MRKFWDNPETRSPATAQESPPVKPVPRSLAIGNVTISPATVLAPMAGVTDTVFRRFIRNLGGCGLIMTEFTSADGVLRKKDQKAKRYLHFYEDEHPISAQLFGSVSISSTSTSAVPRKKSSSATEAPACSATCPRSAGFLHRFAPPCRFPLP